MPKRMKKSDFEKIYEDRIRESAYQEIQEEEEYKDGYNGPIEEYIDEIFENNYDQFVEDYAEMKGIKLI